VDQCCGIRAFSREQRQALRVVLAINVVMFLVELGAGVLARSIALLADSADMLGDALAYGFSLYAVARGPVWQARAAMLKGTIMAGFGIVALMANGACLWLLWRRRADDLNLRSAWLCSRNDVLANVGVLVAAGGVAITGSGWADVLVGLAIAMLVAGSALGVLREAGQALRPAHRAS
jgi:Co/Zn/Cd efflux system component